MWVQFISNSGKVIKSFNMRNCCKTLVYFFLALYSNVGGDTIDIDRVVRKANIYYQQPLLNGKPLEFPLSIVESLKSKQDIKVIIHGFLGNRFHNSIRPLSNAYMARGVDNVFIADWKDAANLDYYTSRKAVGKVGVYLAQLLEEFINKHEIPLAELHIIGHSLGAHIAGNIGYYFNGSLGRVTGLDPALPLFAPNSLDSLQSNAGAFVDVIHTDYPVFGDITPRGTADFYPNYGDTPQKGCDDDALLTANSCSHNRAVTLYAESIGLPKSFPAVPCSMSAIRAHTSSKCFQTLNELGLSQSTLAEAIASENQDVVVYMGEYVSKSALGVFYLETYDASPYGMGVYTQVTKNGH